MWKNFALELRLWHLECFQCLYREAIRLQCFTPTHYVRDVATSAHKRNDHYPICSILFLLALCTHYVPQFFFLLSVWACLKNYTLSRKKNPTKLMIGHLKMDPGPEIQYACRLEHKLSDIRLDSHLGPCLYMEAIRLQCFTPTRYVRGVVTRAHKRDDHYPICSIMLKGHLLAFYCACSYTMCLFSDNFFSA